jgi:hypothetical protein
MEHLQKCIEALQVLAASQLTEVNRLPVAEMRINEYVRPEIAALRSSLERLIDAWKIEAEARPTEDAFWSTVRDYLVPLISKLPE